MQKIPGVPAARRASVSRATATASSSRATATATATASASIASASASVASGTHGSQEGGDGDGDNVTQAHTPVHVPPAMVEALPRNVGMYMSYFVFIIPLIFR